MLNADPKNDMAVQQRRFRQAAAVLRILIILMSAITVILLGLAFRLSGATADWEFYADGLGPVYVCMAFAAVSFPLPNSFYFLQHVLIRPRSLGPFHGAAAHY